MTKHQLERGLKAAFLCRFRNYKVKDSTCAFTAFAFDYMGIINSVYYSHEEKRFVKIVYPIGDGFKEIIL